MSLIVACSSHGSGTHAGGEQLMCLCFMQLALLLDVNAVPLAASVQVRGAAEQCNRSPSSAGVVGPGPPVLGGAVTVVVHAAVGARG